MREELIFSADTKVSRERAAELLDTLGLDSVGDRVVRTLSGAQPKMCALAIGMVNNPSVLLVDEPTNQLDRASRHLVVDLTLPIRPNTGRG